MSHNCHTPLHVLQELSHADAEVLAEYHAGYQGLEHDQAIW